MEAEGEESVLAQEREVVAGIHDALSELQNSVQDLSKESLAKIFRLGQYLCTTILFFHFLCSGVCVCVCVYGMMYIMRGRLGHN